MPRPTPDIVEAASRCFHFNMSMLVPDYIVIKSNKRNRYAVTTIGMFRLNQAPQKSDDWEIAINLSSEDIMSLMGLIPKKPIDPGSDTEWVPDPPRTDPPSEIREVNSHASSPENL
jgi:hypothetical protein